MLDYKHLEKHYIIFESANLRLIINRIRPEDNGIYECIANNEIGSTSSSARLTVVDFMPRFDGNAMPKRVFAVVGSELVHSHQYE